MEKNDEKNNDDDRDEDDIFLDQWARVIDEMVSTDVSTRESLSFANAAEYADPIGPLDAERITTDLFAIRIRFAIAVIAMNVISGIARPRKTWAMSLRGMKSAHDKLSTLISLMESMRNEEERG